jgi:fructokinase
VFGEALIDLFVFDDGRVTAVAGGGPLNVARAVSRLGVSSLLFCRLSTDIFGRKIGHLMDADQVSLAFVDRSTLPTPLAIVESDRDEPRYTFHLNKTSAFQIGSSETIQRFLSISPSIAAIYIGTLGVVVEPMAEAIQTLLEEIGAVPIVILDPNCRPSAVPDPNLYRERLTRLFAYSDVVKVSVEDLAFISPGLDADASANSILKAGPTLIIVTDGSEDVRVYSQGGVRTIAVPQVEVVDTVGAGDALVGAFLAWWARRGFSRSSLKSIDRVMEAVEYATKVSSLTCTVRGGEPPTFQEVEQFECEA